MKDNVGKGEGEREEEKKGRNVASKTEQQTKKREGRDRDKLAAIDARTRYVKMKRKEKREEERERDTRLAEQAKQAPLLLSFSLMSGVISPSLLLASRSPDPFILFRPLKARSFISLSLFSLFFSLLSLPCTILPSFLVSSRLFCFISLLSLITRSFTASPMTSLTLRVRSSSSLSSPLLLFTSSLISSSPIISSRHYYYGRRYFTSHTSGGKIEENNNHHHGHSTHSSPSSPSPSSPSPSSSSPPTIAELQNDEIDLKKYSHLFANPKVKAIIDRIIRVDQAGEFGAARMYHQFSLFLLLLSHFYFHNLFTFSRLRMVEVIMKPLLLNMVVCFFTFVTINWYDGQLAVLKNTKEGPLIEVSN